MSKTWNDEQGQIINMLCEKFRQLADKELDMLKENGVISNWKFLGTLEV